MLRSLGLFSCIVSFFLSFPLSPSCASSSVLFLLPLSYPHSVEAPFPLIPTPQPTPRPENGLKDSEDARRRRQIRSRFRTIAKSLPWGLLVVSEDSTIIFASDLALSLLEEEGSGLSSKSGAFRVKRASVDRGMQDLIRLNALGAVPTRKDSDPNVVGVPDLDGRIRYAIRVLPFADEGQEESGLALVAIIDLKGQQQIKRSAAASIFQLSDREAEFAVLFSRGFRIKEIAVRMEVAVNTARVHLRNVFQKTGCSNQIELARRFALLP